MKKPGAAESVLDGAGELCYRSAIVLARPIISHWFMSLRRFVLISFALALPAWGGLAALIHFFAPTEFLQAAALALAALAVAATTMPLWWRVQQRLTPRVNEITLPRMATRQGIWTGLYVAALLVLRLNRLLDGALVFVLLALFVILEVFIQQRGQVQGAASTKPAAKEVPSATPKATYSRQRSLKSDGKSSRKRRKT